MGFVRRIFGAAVLLVVLLVGLQIAASESGEVIVLRTFSATGEHTTRIWIVDDQGVSWVRSGKAEAGWYQRILENPDVEVERGDDLYAYRAFPIDGGPTVDHVNALMARKYGWADGLIGAMFDRSGAVAIRLDPR